MISTESLTIMGHVSNIEPDKATFTVTTRSGESFTINVTVTTNFDTFRYLGSFSRNRVVVSKPDCLNSKIAAYVKDTAMIVIEGILIKSSESVRIDAKQIYFMSCDADPTNFEFETSHWWLNQIERLADEWLDDIFGDKRTYSFDDFAALYRTNLNILGLPTDDNIQEMATLSRLIYGLSSAYLLTGNIRYFYAAKAGVDYQRSTFRCLTHDGQCCFWFYGRRRGKYGSELIFGSLNDDDYESVPLYEQIYALAGLTQFYRITADPEILLDIQRTLGTFERFYRDGERNKDNKGYPGLGGYFSHIDAVTLRPDTDYLKNRNNQLKKNWNSIGDHIPAYLTNLLLSLDPLPKGLESQYEPLLDQCREMLDETTELIVKNFPDPDVSVPFVRERFHHDWSVDSKYSWQQDRAIIGHNFKIAWNLTRSAKYYRCRKQNISADKKLSAEQKKAMESQLNGKIDSLIKLACKLADSMMKVGIDQVRGGVFDALERNPKNGMPLEFAWGSTKDFWQQEQGILAYQILFGETGELEYLNAARELAAFWNLYFLDHDNRGIYFRVADNGTPVLKGSYANKGGHSISGYHTFELNFLAHIYLRTYFKTGTDNFFKLHFRPIGSHQQKTINVLPDFMNPNDVQIKAIYLDGVPQQVANPSCFQISTAGFNEESKLTVLFQSRTGHSSSKSAETATKTANQLEQTYAKL